MTSGRSGRFVMDSTWAAYVGPGLAARTHRHHAVQLVVPLDGGVRLRGAGDARWRSYSGAVIGSGAPHESDRAVDVLVSVWLEPEQHGFAGTGIRAVPRGTTEALKRDLAGLRDQPMEPAAWRPVIEQTLARLGVVRRPAHAIDDRVATAMRLCNQHLVDPFSLADAAVVTGVSASRLRHLFARDAGISFRRYRLWCRLRAAVAELGRGSSLTTASHSVGFADSAHLSRTFHSMIGFTPSAGLARAAVSFKQQR